MRQTLLNSPTPQAAELPRAPGAVHLLARPLAIGGAVARNRVFLAPMSGVSDVAFRRAAWAAGAGMVTSEMVASEALVTGKPEMRLKAESGGLPVHMVQLAGREAKWMAEAARIAEAGGADIIDINMGCPARRVTTGYAGSALMRDLDHAMTLIEAVVRSVTVPVTLKMRLGWDDDHRNAPELARRAVASGISMITVHGRTRCQFYKGRADWRAVAAVREAVAVPLIVNGDIASLAEARNALRLSGADGVMIGRASYGQPDLPGQIAAEAAGKSPAVRYEIVDHYAEMIAFYGAGTGVRCARKHLDWYLSRLPMAVPTALRTELLRSTDPARITHLLEALPERSGAGQQARAA